MDSESLGMALGLAEEIGDDSDSYQDELDHNDLNDTARSLYDVMTNEDGAMGIALGLAEEIAEEEHLNRVETMSKPFKRDDDERDLPTKAFATSLKNDKTKTIKKLRPFEEYVNALISGDEVDLPF